VKRKLCSLEEDFTQKTQIQQAEIDQLSADLRHAVQVRLLFAARLFMYHQPLLFVEALCVARQE